MRTVIINREEEKTIPASLENLLPFRLTDAVRRAAEQPEVGIVEEIRLRRGRCASLTSGGRNIILDVVLGGDEMEGVMNRLCGGSLYAYSDTICRGYITLAGGVRAGICGRAAIDNGRIIGVSEVSSIVLRLPHRTPGVGGELCRLLVSLGLSRGVLVYSPPGVGKTTVLRGAAAQLASGSCPLRVAVVDTRGELCAGLDMAMLTIDILSGYPRGEGIEIAARTLGAQVIICDEIGDTKEAEAIMNVHNCGVPLLASAHAARLEELMKKPGIAVLHKSRCFGVYAGLRRVAGRPFVYNYDISGWEAADELL
jgi:stage III sporulation protein AA